MSNRTPIKRRYLRPPYALLIIGDGRLEFQRHAPVNFYDWQEKTQRHYLTKRWPQWKWCNNGQPWQMGGRKVWP